MSLDFLHLAGLAMAFSLVAIINSVGSVKR